MSASPKSARSVPPRVLKSLKVAALVRHLGTVAERIGVRFVVLKGGALHALKLVGPNDRAMGDLDILLAPDDAARLNDELLKQGWKDDGLPRGEDHLPRLAHAVWPALELHDQLGGVTRDGRTPAGFADLEQAGALEPLKGAGPAVFVPSRELLAAHAVAHAFIHHKAVAPFYPLRRAFDDLRAIGAVEMTDEEFLAGPGRWIDPELAPEDVLTILRLARRLARGEDVAAGPPTPESRLLEHVRRSEVDDDYKGASRLLNFRHLAGTGPDPVRTFLRRARTVVFINRYQVDTLYGKPKHEWGYAVRQVLRPFDLVLRVVRYAFVTIRLRLRGETPPPLDGMPKDSVRAEEGRQGPSPGPAER